MREALRQHCNVSEGTAGTGTVCSELGRPRARCRPVRGDPDTYADARAETHRSLRPRRVTILGKLIGGGMKFAGEGA